MISKKQGEKRRGGQKHGCNIVSELRVRPEWDSDSNWAAQIQQRVIYGQGSAGSLAKERGNKQLQHIQAAYSRTSQQEDVFVPSAFALIVMPTRNMATSRESEGDEVSKQTYYQSSIQF